MTRILVIDYSMINPKIIEPLNLNYLKLCLSTVIHNFKWLTMYGICKI